MVDNILQIDRELLVFLNNLGSEQYDSFWLAITNQFTWAPLFVFILFLIFKSLGFKKGMFTLFFIIILIAFSDQFTNVIRGIFERLRPNNDLNVNYLLRDKLINPQSYSFTSGHATTSTIFTVFIFLLLKDVYKQIKLLFFFPVIFSYSRLYLGVHFPTDIMAGTIIGAFLGFIFYKVYMLLINRVMS
ncbi:phosphatase PAP2 family protein [Tenacibaculum sp. nBUS_03]|uniref:phosphatase PAP2 family protein n=1 Tax=Tenacibaculum sp. nBUS_03 TaxID=3395320 RepID=UPI003EC052B0